jgi:Dolichyl-phosphate-mannose-protein mannosyltransferase
MTHATTTRAGTTARSAPLPAVHDAARLLAVLFCLLFFLEGLVFIPYAGLQNDEVLFGGGIYPPWGVQHVIRVGGHTFPTMIMSYIGTLKAWLYRLFVFPLWAPSAWSVRIPVLLIGALTLWIFFELVRRTAGARTALMATALVATDATFVLTTCLDWGPVALQHALLLGGALSLVYFHESEKRWWLACGFFLFGLGLWDKALFSWPLAGLAAATAVVFPRAFRAKLTGRNVAVAVLAMVAGAAPLLAYNLSTHAGTVRDNAQPSTERFAHKLVVLRNSLEGSSLFGYLVREDSPVEPALPRNGFERLSLDLSEATGRTRTGWLSLAVVLAFALLPWVWRTPARRPMLFALIFMVVTWLQMALISQGGRGTHHTALLWPFPHLFVAAAFAEVSRPLSRAGLAVLALAAVLLCGINVVVLNEHLARLIDGGSTTVWTDAIYPLSDKLRDTRATRVYVADWGILNSLRVLNRGTLPLEPAPDWFLLDNERKLPPEELAAKGAIFIGHTAGNEITAGTAERLESLAESAGLRRQVLETINDRYARPVFEVYRFARR